MGNGDGENDEGRMKEMGVNNQYERCLFKNLFQIYSTTKISFLTFVRKRNNMSRPSAPLGIEPKY